MRARVRLRVCVPVFLDKCADGGKKAPLAVCVTDSDGYLSIIQRCHSQNKMLFIVRLAWGRGRQTGAGRESLKHTIAEFTRVISAAASFIHRKSKQHISVC